LTSLTELERVDARRFCGYPAYGAAPAGTQSWRYFQAYGQLEFRLTNLSAAEVVIVRRYLVTLATLELAIPAASDNLDTDEASIWKHNKNELTDRIRLFDEWRRRLCGFIGVVPGVALSNGTAVLVV
jgi:hypothetical protein